MPNVPLTFSTAFLLAMGKGKGLKGRTSTGAVRAPAQPAIFLGYADSVQDLAQLVSGPLPSTTVRTNVTIAA